VSEEKKPHSAKPVHVSKSEGGGSKWLLGAAAAVVLIGGGLVAWQNFGPSAERTQTAYNNDNYDASLHARPIESSQGAATQGAVDGDITATPAAADARPAAPARRTTPARAQPIPEQTIGVTPISATTQDDDELVVTGARRPIWASTPNARRLSALYPERALDRGREGEASLHCIVQERGALDCERVSETPARAGFGTAALRVARTLRHSTTLADGSAAAGTPVNLRVVFRIEDEQRRGRG